MLVMLTDVDAVYLDWGMPKARPLSRVQAGDLSAARLGAWGDQFYAGVQAIRKLVYAFYTPEFSFGAFIKKHPQFKDTIPRLLIGDVMQRDVDAVFGPMGEMIDLPSDIRLQSSADYFTSAIRASG